MTQVTDDQPTLSMERATTIASILKWRKVFEETALKQIEEKHPDFEWYVGLLDHGRRVGVRVTHSSRGRQIIGPREDVIAIADALAEEVAATNDQA